MVESKEDVPSHCSRSGRYTGGVQETRLWGGCGEVMVAVFIRNEETGPCDRYAYQPMMQCSTSTRVIAHLQGQWAGMLGDQEVEEVCKEREHAVAGDDQVESRPCCCQCVELFQACGLKGHCCYDKPDGGHRRHVQQQTETVETL